MRARDMRPNLKLLTAALTILVATLATSAPTWQAPVAPPPPPTRTPHPTWTATALPARPRPTPAATPAPPPEGEIWVHVVVEENGGRATATNGVYHPNGRQPPLTFRGNSAARTALESGSALTVTLYPLYAPREKPPAPIFQFRTGARQNLR